MSTTKGRAKLDAIEWVPRLMGASVHKAARNVLCGLRLG